MQFFSPHHGKRRVPDVILEERAIDMLVEDLAGLARDRHRLVATEALEVIIPLLQQERQPADLALGQQQPQLGVAVERAREDEIEQRVRESLVFVFVASLRPSGRLFARLDVGMAGQDVADHRRTGFGAAAQAARNVPR